MKLNNLRIFTIVNSVWMFLFDFFGKYSDRFGRKPFLILAGYFTGLIIFAYTLINNVFQLYILQILWGFVGAMEETVRKKK